MTAKIPLPNKDVLEHQYTVLGIPQAVLSKVYACDRTVIRKWLLEYNIPIRGKKEKNGRKSRGQYHYRWISTPPKDEIVRLYMDEKKNLIEIGQIYNCSRQTVTRWLKEYGIHIKPAHQRPGVYLGNKCCNWKGGISEWRNYISTTPIYKAWRKAVFERDHFTCQMCCKRGGNLQAHHIQPIRDHKNDLLILDINNGITLCEDCHRKTFGKEDEFIDQFNNILRLER